MRETIVMHHDLHISLVVLFEVLGLRIGPPPPNGAGGQHPGRMVVRLWEEVKIMKAEEQVVGVSRRNW